ncbi:MAG TPA: hypothetical protein VNT76_12230 [Candidatus Binatus sp.]|nr:hypothetical protein [Candidatus Binatus sp.]
MAGNPHAINVSAMEYGKLKDPDGRFVRRSARGRRFGNYQTLLIGAAIFLKST